MAQKHREAHGQGFTVLVCNHPYGSVPDHNNPIYQNPPPMRQAFTYQAISINGAGGVHSGHVNGLLGGGYAPKTATLTVANNDFSTGSCLLILGEYQMLAGVDYAIGGTVASTASNMAAAIDNLPGYTAVVLAGSTVEITYDQGPMDEVDFSVQHLGTILNMTPLVPGSGIMANGSPTIQAPAQS